MKLKEITYTIREGLPSSQYDYEIVSATAELVEGEDEQKAMTELRKYVITSTTKYKKGLMNGK